MTELDVIDIYNAFERAGVVLWIDGGWAVDALLGEQTRIHNDLDIAIEEKFVARARAILEARGYLNVPRDDTSRWNFVLGDASGREVDLHAFVRNVSGDVVDGIRYPTESLTGWGRIGGQAVRCIEPASLVRFHTGYPIRDSDRADVAALCRRFKIALPAEYQDSSPPATEE